MLNRKIHTSIALVVVLSIALFSACSDDDNNGGMVGPAPTGTVTLHFDNNVGGAALQFNQMIYTNDRGTVYSISKLQYVVSRVELHKTNGEVFGTSALHYRDAEDPSTRSMTIANVPAGTYDRVSFIFGLNEVDNVRDKYINQYPRFHSDMAWPTPMGPEVGYHYMKLEGNFQDSPTTTAGYTTHTGARQFDGTNPMAPGVVDDTPHHHFFYVELPVAATMIDGNDWEITVDADANAWYTDHTPGDSFDSSYDWNDLSGQLIMGNLDAQAKLMTNGPLCFSASIQAAP